MGLGRAGVEGINRGAAQLLLGVLKSELEKAPLQDIPWRISRDPPVPLLPSTPRPPREGPEAQRRAPQTSPFFRAPSQRGAGPGQRGARQVFNSFHVRDAGPLCAGASALPTPTQGVRLAAGGGTRSRPFSPCAQRTAPPKNTPNPQQPPTPGARGRGPNLGSLGEGRRCPLCHLRSAQSGHGKTGWGTPCPQAGSLTWDAPRRAPISQGLQFQPSRAPGSARLRPCALPAPDSSAPRPAACP